MSMIQIMFVGNKINDFLCNCDVCFSKQLLFTPVSTDILKGDISTTFT